MLRPAKGTGYYDIYLPKQKLIIEFDGITYHHTNPTLGIFSKRVAYLIGLLRLD